MASQKCTKQKFYVFILQTQTLLKKMLSAVTKYNGNCADQFVSGSMRAMPPCPGSVIMNFGGRIHDTTTSTNYFICSILDFHLAIY